MFASPKAKAAAAAALLALIIVLAPLLPPLSLAGKLQSVFGLSWKTAYLAATVGLPVALYGSLGAMAASAVEQFRRNYGRAGSKRHRQTVAEIEARLNRCAVLSPP